MSIVTLVSGGIDSSLMALLAQKEGIRQFPLFFDYGQLCRDRELAACKSFHEKHGLPVPEVMQLAGFGNTISSGLTDVSKDVFADAFLPGRNMLFLLAGYSFAYQNGANAVTIGLLNEDTHIFPDQTQEFLNRAESILSFCMGRAIRIVAPLMSFHKSDILELAEKYGIINTYSCHSGTENPCGICVSCREIIGARA